MWQDEYEELLHYAAVTPKFEQCVSKWSEPASELRAGGRFSSVTDDAIHRKTPGSMCKESYVLSLQERWYNFFDLSFLIATVWKIYVTHI